jgi:TolA-binding protein
MHVLELLLINGITSFAISLYLNVYSIWSKNDEIAKLTRGIISLQAQVAELTSTVNELEDKLEEKKQVIQSQEDISKKMQDYLDIHYDYV